MIKVVDIVLADRGWILERCGAELETRLPYVRLTDAAASPTTLAYYVNYSAWRGRQAKREAAFFTHLEPSPDARDRFFEVARSVDRCVSMANVYTNLLIEKGISDVTTILPGVDLENYRPLVRIGVVGRTYGTGRKGEWLLADLGRIDGVEFVGTQTDWGLDGRPLREAEMPDFFRSLDYLLVTAAYEGGPMPVIEALAAGVEIIAPPVGFVPDYPHISYNPLDAEGLKALIERLVEQKLRDRAQRVQSVQSITWDSWASQHDRLFRSMLRDCGDDIVMHVVPDRPAADVRLVLHGAEHALRGGPSVRVRALQEGLQRRGWSASLASSAEREPNALVHIFNIWEPQSCRDEIRGALDRGMHVLFSPILLDLRTMYRYLPLRDLFAEASTQGEAQVDRLMQDLDNDTIPCRPDMKANLDRVLDQYVSLGRSCLEEAGHVLFLSDTERRLAKDWFGVEPAGTVVYNGVAVGSGEDPTAFANRQGIFDYVLCVGRIEPRKNQLLLVEALRGSGISVVLIGAVSDRRYADLVAARGEGMVHMIGRVPPNSGLLRSAFRGARVFALPSWTEGGPLAALEAAMAGTPLVLGSGGSEQEYFGDFARYCKAGNLSSIRTAIMEAYESPRSQAETCRQVAHFEANFSTERMIEKTIAAYRQTDRPVTLSTSTASGARPPVTRACSVDEIAGPFVTGWVARLAEESCRPEVAVLIDGKLASLARAQLYRPDLALAGAADSHCGFHIELAESAFDDAEHQIDVKVIADTEYYVSSQRLRLNRSDLGILHHRRRFQGFVDVVTMENVQGWVRNIFDDRDKPAVELLVDGRIVGEELASLPRQDLISKPIGDGHHAFVLTIPSRISLQGGAHDLRVRVKGTDFEMWRSPGAIDFAALARMMVRRNLSNRAIILDGALTILPRLAMGAETGFSVGQPGSRMLMEGWSAPEPWGTWSTGYRAKLAFSPAGDVARAHARIKVRGFSPGNQRKVHVDIYINRTKVGSWSLTHETAEMNVALDTGGDRGGTVMEFAILNPASPSEMGLNSDRRLLGFGLMSLTLVPA